MAERAPRGRQHRLHPGDGGFWVIESFLSKIDGVPPRGSVTVKYSELIESGRSAADRASSNNTVRKAELQTPQALFTVPVPTRK